jgi:CheY-like chemotaxis protein
VEDARELRERVVRFLRKEGFHVYGTGGAQQALMALREAPRPTLILADLMTPNMDGAMLLEAMDRDDRLVTLPVVMVTTNDPKSPRGFRRAKNLIDLDDLLRVVQGLCARRT